MKKWHAQLEYFQFPLKILFFATILLGIGSILVNENLTEIWDTNHKIVILISEILKYSGGFLIRIFPLFIFFKVISRKFEDTVPIFVGFISVIIIQLIVLMLESTKSLGHDFPSYFYNSILGIHLTFPTTLSEGFSTVFREGLCLPFEMGILIFILSYFITTHCYLKSRHYSMRGIMSFIDHDTWSMILTIVYSVIVGIVIFYIWPYVIQVIQYIFHYISSDILNPIHMFLYGIMERLFALVGLQDITRSAFWFSELGGTATDSFGVLYNGDVNTWYAMQNLDIVTTNAGHLITPYYIINIFIIPSFMLAYLSLVSNKKDRNRYYMFFIIAILLSVLCGNSLPFEIFIAILAPLLYIIYLLMVGFLYAIFQIMGISIGYYFEGSVMIANPGSLIDLLQYIYEPKMVYSISALIGIGLFTFILMFILTRCYFKYFAIGIFNINLQKQVTTRVVTALGGIQNITSISTTPDKMTVHLVDKNIVAFDDLRNEGAYLILESKDGYLLRLSNLNIIVGRNIKNLIEDYKKRNISM